MLSVAYGAFIACSLLVAYTQCIDKDVSRNELLRVAAVTLYGVSAYYVGKLS